MLHLYAFAKYLRLAHFVFVFNPVIAMGDLHTVLCLFLARAPLHHSMSHAVNILMLAVLACGRDSQRASPSTIFRCSHNGNAQACHDS